jgi:hypothetical protein
MKRLLVFSFLLLLFFSSCQKAGTGGDYSITAFPKHHGKSINNGVVYIKYNADELPGQAPSDFDASAPVVAHPGEGAHAHFHELKKGDYYIYHIGYDSTISQTVKGGIPIKLKKDKAVDLDIPVTED